MNRELNIGSDADKCDDDVVAYEIDVECEIGAKKNKTENYWRGRLVFWNSILASFELVHAARLAFQIHRGK